MAEGFGSRLAQALREDGRRIVITGAGGWLGSATLDLLAETLGENFITRVRSFGSSSRILRLSDGTQILQRPLADIAWLPQEPTLVLHTAFLTKDRAETMNEADYVAANRSISQTVLDALGRIGTEAIFVASSGAAAKAEDPTADAAMRLYGRLKMEDEERFARWSRDSGRKAVITRIHALTGPHINKPGAYAIGSFIADALAGRPIEVRAPRRVVRAYVAIRELMELVFAMLLNGHGTMRFDSGGQPLELAEVAAAVAALVPKARVQRAPISQLEADVYCGDGPAYDRLLAQYDVTPVPLATQLAEMIAWLQSAPAGNGNIQASKTSLSKF